MGPDGVFRVAIFSLILHQDVLHYSLFLLVRSLEIFRLPSAATIEDKTVGRGALACVSRKHRRADRFNPTKHIPLSRSVSLLKICSSYSSPWKVPARAPSAAFVIGRKWQLKKHADRIEKAICRE